MKLWGAGLLMELGFIGLATLRRPSEDFRTLAVLYTLLFVVLLGVFLQGQGRAGLLTRGQRWGMWGFAVLFRLTLFAAPSILAYDAYQGIPAMHPPLTNAVSQVGSRLSGTLMSYVGVLSAEGMGQKAVFLLFDLLTLFLLGSLLKDYALPEGRMVYYAWNPLVVLEFAGSGHTESLGLFCLLAAVWLWGRRQFALGGGALAAAFLAKYLAVLALPYVIWQKRWKALVLFLGLGAAGVFFFSSGPLVLEVAGFPFAERPFNGSFFAVLQALIGSADIAKKIVAMLLAAFAVWIGKSQKDLLKACYLLTAAALLLSPTVHPWYFVWLIPFLCFFPNAAFLTWNGTIILSYTLLSRYAATQSWDLHPVVPWFEYVPVYTLLAWEAWRKRSSAAA